MKAYENQARTSHENPVVKDGGFHIHCEHPFFGASLDSHVRCICCGEGVVEVKCPHYAKDSTLEIIADGSKQFCLQIIITKYSFKWLHQKLITVILLYGHHTHLICILKEFDEDFFEESVVKAEHFYKVGVLPDLLGKWYSTDRKPEAIVSCTRTKPIYNCQMPI